MENSIQKKLEFVLSLPAEHDTEVNEVASIIFERIWPALLACIPSESDYKLDYSRMQNILEHTLHWAVHIGQSAHQIIALKQSKRIDAHAVSDKWDIIERLYHRPLIMLGDDGDGLLGVLNILRIEVFAMDASILDNEHIAESLVFTSSRLSVDIQLKNSCLSIESGNYTSELLEDHLYKSADLYVANLKWLVCASEQSHSEIIDCFISECAIALSMSGDALRLLWPVVQDRGTSSIR